MSHKLSIEKTKHKVLGKAIYHFPIVESTNKIAFSFAEKGEKEGTVIVADEQFKGEGRRGRKWFSPSGGLWFSIILRPFCSPEQTFIYPLIAAATTAETIRKISSSYAYISWPNDTFIRGKKIGGAMCKLKVEKEKVKWAILGVGVNLNVKHFPSSLENSATSLLLETHRLTYPFYFLDCFLNILENLYFLSKLNQTSLINKLQNFFPFTGKLVRLTFSGEDKIVQVKGIDCQGHLIVESEEGLQQTITPGESVSIDYLGS